MLKTEIDVHPGRRPLRLVERSVAETPEPPRSSPQPKRSQGKPGTHYRPEIDGLRALAVIAVVLFHLGLGVPGGYIGVDVFFVISGFLITGIIRRAQIDGNKFSLVEFWERRTRRIFPAVFVMLAATLAIGYWMLLPGELVTFGRSAIHQALLLANIYFSRNTGYFAEPAEFQPLLHTWSLAVEEQFYLFFPAALCALKRVSAIRLVTVLAITAAASFGASVYGVMFHSEASFYLLPARAWELLVGCILAVLPLRWKPAPRRDSMIATLGLAGIVLPMFLYDVTTPFPGLAAAPPVLGTAAIIFAASCSPGIWLCKALSFRPVVFIGLISYSLYLWHWPTIVYTRLYFGRFETPQILFTATVSFLIAVLSWRLVETPFRRATWLRERRRLFKTAFGLTGVAIAVSGLFIIADGCAWRFPQSMAGHLEDAERKGIEYRREVPKSGHLSLACLPPLGKRSELTAGRRLDFVLLGDSHGMAVAKCIDEIAGELQLSGKSAVASGTTVLTHYSTREERDESEEELRTKRELVKLLDKVRPKNLVLIACWGHLHDLTFRPYSGLSNSSIIKKGLHEWAQFCAARDIKLRIVKQVPETKEPAPAKSLLRYLSGRSRILSDQRATLADHEHQQRRIEEVFRSLEKKGVAFVDPAPLLIDSQQFVMNYWGGRALYRDTHHLTSWGAQRVRPVLEEMFRQMK